MDGFRSYDTPHKGWDCFQSKYQEKALMGWLCLRLYRASKYGAKPVEAGHRIKITFIPEEFSRWEIWCLVTSRWDDIRWDRDLYEDCTYIRTSFDGQFFNSEKELEAVAMLKSLPLKGFYTWSASRSDIVNEGARYRVKRPSQNQIKEKRVRNQP